MPSLRTGRTLGCLFITCLILIASCKTKKVEINELEEYFQDNKIEVIIKKGLMSIFVNNSKLINRERNKEGVKWDSAESFASIGALICFDYIKNKSINIDTIIIQVKNENKIEMYEFYIEDLIRIKKEFLICSEFAELTSNKEFVKAKLLLGNSIVNATPKIKLDSFMVSMYSSNPVVKNEILAFKVTPSYDLIYLNSYFKNQSGITYIYGFTAGKIVGITPP